MSRPNRALSTGFLAVVLFLGLGGHAFAQAPLEDPLDPSPTPAEATMTLETAAATGIPPGQAACSAALSAANSAGTGGSIAFSGTLNKRPKLNVWWLDSFTNFFTDSERIYSQKLFWNGFGQFEVVLNTSNGYSVYFPGVFQFCIKNPPVNTQTIFIDAVVVTF